MSFITITIYMYYNLHVQMVSHSKEVAVVTESIHCLGQKTEQYEVCFPEFNVFVLQR